MKKGRFFLVLIVTAFLIGCFESSIDDIRSPTKRIKKDGDVVFVEGRWKEPSRTRPGIISRINFTSITCDRKDMKYREAESLLFTPREQPVLKHSQLYNQEFTYQVIHWADETIKAKREALVADIEITISLKDNCAEKGFRETKARGSDTANPDVFGKWVLE
jgi:hypothetical protein